MRERRATALLTAAEVQLSSFCEQIVFVSTRVDERVVLLAKSLFVFLSPGGMRQWSGFPAHRARRSPRSTTHKTLPELNSRSRRQGRQASRPARLRTHRPSAELTSPSLHSIAATALLLACSLSSSSSTALSEPRAVCPSPRASTATHLGRVEDLTYVEAQRPTRRLAEAVRCFGGRSGPCRRSRRERSRP